MSYKNYIEAKRQKYVGTKAYWEGELYTIVKVDYNGVLHIDKPGQFTDTTAVGSYVNSKGEIK
jgi:hypothetical protein